LLQAEPGWVNGQVATRSDDEDGYPAIAAAMRRAPRQPPAYLFSNQLPLFRIE
jgi:hypothetical protein